MHHLLWQSPLSFSLMELQLDQPHTLFHRGKGINSLLKRATFCIFTKEEDSLVIFIVSSPGAGKLRNAESINVF